jgi:hypothetical protein
MIAFLFTFEDQRTGDLADTIAPNEAAARLRLGGDWIDVKRAPLWAQPSEVGDLPRIIQEALEDELVAHAAVHASLRRKRSRNSLMPKGRIVGLKPGDAH